MIEAYRALWRDKYLSEKKDEKGTSILIRSHLFISNMSVIAWVEGWKENSMEVKINCFCLPPQLIYTLLSDNTVNEALPKS